MRGYFTAMSKFASFRGRASRSEFWQFVLITWAILALAYVVLSPGPHRSIWPTFLFAIVALLHALPYFAVLTRRLHDLDTTGWWALVGLVPGVGLGLLIPALFAGSNGSNKFGADPLLYSRTNHGGNAPTGRVEPPFGSNMQAPRGNSTIDQMEKIAALRASGALSEVEFEGLKIRLLSEGRGL